MTSTSSSPSPSLPSSSLSLSSSPSSSHLENTNQHYDKHNDPSISTSSSTPLTTFPPLPHLLPPSFLSSSHHPYQLPPNVPLLLLPNNSSFPPLPPLPSIPPSPATSMSQFFHYRSLLHPPSYVALNHEIMNTHYRPLPTDVIITPFSKCGTTFIQQIFHQLRCPADESFGEITYVVPWLDRMAYVGVDVNWDQRREKQKDNNNNDINNSINNNESIDTNNNSPWIRGYKSHFSHSSLPQGIKYLNVTRNPLDQLVSMYHFMGSDWYLSEKSIDINTFAREWWLDSHHNKYFEHFVSWGKQYKIHNNPNLLQLSYEFVSNPIYRSLAIALIADFIGIPLTSHLLSTVFHYSSFEYMSHKAHSSLFNDHPMKLWACRTVGLGMDNGHKDEGEKVHGIGKVRKGKTGEGENVIDEKVKETIRNLWAEKVEKEEGLGWTNYQIFEEELRGKLKEKGEKLLLDMKKREEEKGKE